MPRAPFKKHGGPSGIGSDVVHFLVHGGWNSKDVNMAGICDCVKVCVTFIR